MQGSLMAQTTANQAKLFQVRTEDRLNSEHGWSKKGSNVRLLSHSDMTGRAELFTSNSHSSYVSRGVSKYHTERPDCNVTTFIEWPQHVTVVPNDRVGDCNRVGSRFNTASTKQFVTEWFNRVEQVEHTHPSSRV